MKYNDKLSIIDNVKMLYNRTTYANNSVIKNKSNSDTLFNENDDALIDIASVASDDSDAIIELADMVAKLQKEIEDLKAKIE